MPISFVFRITIDPAQAFFCTSPPGLVCVEKSAGRHEHQIRTSDTAPPKTAFFIQTEQSTENTQDRTHVGKGIQWRKKLKGGKEFGVFGGVVVEMLEMLLLLLLM